MKTILGIVSVSFAVLLLASPTRADVVAPWYAACQGKAAGSTCFYNDVNADEGVGTCQNGQCVVGTATATTTATTTATATATVTKSDAGNPPSSSDGACAVGGQTTATRIAPWLLAGSFSLLFLFSRRRRR